MKVQGQRFEPYDIHPKLGQRWKTTERINFGGNIIPKGFITDFRTTPLWAESFVKLFIPKFDLAYVVHDFDYRDQSTSRLKADIKQFKTMSANIIQKILVFVFVRFFGNLYWQKYKKRDITVKYWPLLRKFPGDSAIVLSKDTIRCSSVYMCENITAHIQDMIDKKEVWYHMTHLSFALHEPWHLIQRIRLGWLYYPLQAITRIIPHRYNPFELKANREDDHIHQTPKKSWEEFRDAGLLITSVTKVSH